MKKFLLALIFGIIAFDAVADNCGVISIESSKPFAIRVDRVSLVDYDGRYISIYGKFDTVFKIALPPNHAIEFYNNLLDRMVKCSKKGE